MNAPPLEDCDSDAAAREDTARKAFVRTFAREPIFAVRAPGRVNLIGEHTDYNDGLVMPCAIDLDTAMWVAPRSDRKVRVHSLQFAEQAEFDFECETETGPTAPSSTRLKLGSKVGAWIDYVAGAVFAIGKTDRDVSQLRGFDAVISSRVPIGAGLSSSAALGLAAAWAFALANDLEPGRRELAELAWRGEREYVGIGCGLLDFYASALGRTGKALRIDCRDRRVREIEFPAEIEILIAHSGVTRSVAASRYAERVSECARAVDQARRAGIASAEAISLRDLGPVDLKKLERSLDPIALRRARHVIEENERVDFFAKALEARRFGEAGAILRSGMESLRSNYEASIPELDLLCAVGDAADGCYGSRLTGAGWGGCSIHLIEAGSGPEVITQIEARFAKHFGRTPRTWSVRASRGAGAWLSGVSD